ncbi:serine hydrolase domain-containing protein [Mycolicibacterium confluentis]|uniref:Serine hydrolase n=1 Tax=Mycolicibacterium confluentis TaxID=28047 RepID=A0A7I7XR73_9MYCO|nr:serine hydrolase domain-containing protein [Mycolicibacterium confluentis]MCV7318619.1 beta-lactamase family protein [Mycolicibacterium confluentis]ORV33689.1 penicillin-binding protein [Mycolicibacterium confluentis]BBZ31766.1 serine hydrolase [Mycolicibacterium confluentis]
MRNEDLWAVLDSDVATGRVPGYAAAIRRGGLDEVYVSGRTSFGAAASPIVRDTPFRISSLSKPLGAALTLALMDDGVLRLDDEIRCWLPELADPVVLGRVDGALSDTEPANRPITVAHLLTMTAGWGVVFEPCPLQSAIDEREIGSGPVPPQLTGDEFIRRLAEVPLAFHPGTGWLYDMPFKVLSVLLARATEMTLAELLADRITGPLGLADTGFWVEQADRLPTPYRPTDDGVEAIDLPAGAFLRPPPFEDLSCGLVSSATDLLRFFSAMADGGGSVLRPETVRLMTTDQLTAEQRRQGLDILGPGVSWGMGVGVDVESARPWMRPGRWGWIGGSGTTGHVDPDGSVAVLLTQRELAGAQEGFDEFWATNAACADRAQ